MMTRTKLKRILNEAGICYKRITHGCSIVFSDNSRVKWKDILPQLLEEIEKEKKPKPKSRKKKKEDNPDDNIEIEVLEID